MPVACRRPTGETVQFLTQLETTLDAQGLKDVYLSLPELWAMVFEAGSIQDCIPEKMLLGTYEGDSVWVYLKKDAKNIGQPLAPGSTGRYPPMRREKDDGSSKEPEADGNLQWGSKYRPIDLVRPFSFMDQSGPNTRCKQPFFAMLAYYFLIAGFPNGVPVAGDNAPVPPPFQENAVQWNEWEARFIEALKYIKDNQAYQDWIAGGSGANGANGAANVDSSSNAGAGQGQGTSVAGQGSGQADNDSNATVSATGSDPHGGGQLGGDGAADEPTETVLGAANDNEHQAQGAAGDGGLVGDGVEVSKVNVTESEEGGIGDENLNSEDSMPGRLPPEEAMKQTLELLGSKFGISTAVLSALPHLDTISLTPQRHFEADACFPYKLLIGNLGEHTVHAYLFPHPDPTHSSFMQFHSYDIDTGEHMENGEWKNIIERLQPFDSFKSQNKAKAVIKWYFMLAHQVGRVPDPGVVVTSSFATSLRSACFDMQRKTSTGTNTPLSSFADSRAGTGTPMPGVLRMASAIGRTLVASRANSGPPPRKRMRYVMESDTEEDDEGEADTSLYASAAAVATYGVGSDDDHLRDAPASLFTSSPRSSLSAPTHALSPSSRGADDAMQEPSPSPTRSGSDKVQPRSFSPTQLTVWNSRSSTPSESDGIKPHPFSPVKTDLGED